MKILLSISLILVFLGGTAFVLAQESDDELTLSQMTSKVNYLDDKFTELLNAFKDKNGNPFAFANRIIQLENQVLELESNLDALNEKFNIIFYPNSPEFVPIRIIPETVTTPDVEYYITTDRTAYSLDDTITISGVVNVNHKPPTTRLGSVNSDFNNHTQFLLRIDNYIEDQPKRNLLIHCVRNESIHEDYEVEYDVWYNGGYDSNRSIYPTRDYDSTITPQLCDLEIDEYGIFEVSTTVTGSWHTGEHTVYFPSTKIHTALFTDFIIQ